MSLRLGHVWRFTVRTERVNVGLKGRCTMFVVCVGRLAKSLVASCPTIHACGSHDTLAGENMILNPHAMVISMHSSCIGHVQGISWSIISSQVPYFLQNGNVMRH